MCLFGACMYSRISRRELPFYKQILKFNLEKCSVPEPEMLEHFFFTGIYIVSIYKCAASNWLIMTSPAESKRLDLS